MRKYIFILTLMLLNAAVVLAQSAGVSGRVADENGEPLIGATVMVDGTTTGTTTLADGSFQFSNVASDATLVISYIGYNTHKLDLGGRTNVNITLEAEALRLNDVVVVGYGTMERKDLTGAVGSVSAAEIVNSGVANYDQALAGRIAGVQVTSTDGTPGEGLNITIRGGNSLTGDNSPLYVVDGVALEDFDSGTLNTNDIESLDVLKDASSTAIYGSRGANGVILITTKGGRKDGKTDVTVKASYGISYVQDRMEVMNNYDYANYMLQQAYAQDYFNAIGNTNVQDFYDTYGDIEKYAGTTGVSWQDECFRIAPQVSGNVTFSGGNKKTQFYYSGEALDQQGTLLNTGFSKLTNNLKVTHQIGEKTKLTAQMTYTFYNKTGVSTDAGSYSGTIRDLVSNKTTAGLYTYAYGSESMYDYSYYDDNSDDSSARYFYSPIKNLENTERNRRTNNIRGIFTLNRDLGAGLSLSVNGNYNRKMYKMDLFYNEDTQSASQGTNGISASLTEQMTTDLLGSVQLNHSYKKDGHKLQTMIGSEVSERQYESYSYGAYMLDTDAFGTANLGIATYPSTPTSSIAASSLASFFARANYSYDDKYLVTVNFRADGSSKFAKENRWGYFPSVSGAWRMSSEDFMEDVDWVSSVKLRAGYGLTGNNRIGYYDYATYLGTGTSAVYAWGDSQSASPGLYIQNLGVSDLTWETTAQTSVGIDMGFMKNRITATIDWYRKKTTDLLLDADMALSTGFDTVQQNVGSIKNEGWEFTLNTVNMTKPNFSWYTSFNISTNKNTILALNSGQDALYTQENFVGCNNIYNYVSIVGQEAGQFYGFETDGIYTFDDFNYDTTTGTYVLKDGIPMNGASYVMPGSAKYVDQNGDGDITDDDAVVLGNASPDFYGGITNDFTLWKNFDLSIFFQYSYGNQILNGTMVDNGYATTNKQNKLSTAADVWTMYNSNGSANAIRWNSAYGQPQQTITSDIIEDGSYLKLKNLSLGYNLPASVMETLKIKRMRVYLSAQNIWTLTPYTGYDPEVSMGSQGSLTPGLDASAYPACQTYLAGVEVVF